MYIRGNPLIFQQEKMTHRSLVRNHTGLELGNFYLSMSLNGIHFNISFKK